MRFAISIPQFVSDGEFDPAGFRAYMARAEALGFESAWTLEQPLGMMPFFSPLQTMSYAAACTERIRLGCAVFVTPLHSPVHLAKDLSTLDQLSRGRIDVGVGTGGRHRMFSAFQVDPTSLVARFNEGLRLMKALWTEPRVNFDGRFWQLRPPVHHESLGMTSATRRSICLPSSKTGLRRMSSAPASATSRRPLTQASGGP
jgi:alkanesulfonate monooxygenase SsuD/methylene tetrahydromethanopterin reductase-like flavin-dependent oxidoreductase (luciferase family)